MTYDQVTSRAGAKSGALDAETQPGGAPLAHTRPDVAALVAEAVHHEPGFIRALTARMKARRERGDTSGGASALRLVGDPDGLGGD